MIYGRCWKVKEFLTSLIRQNRCFAETSVTDVDAFLSETGELD
jgi:hypothetical protein